MSDLSIVATRGPLVESRHRVSVALVDHSGRLVAESGDPDLVTFWRSAAKPFQLLPLVEDGGISHFGLDRQMLALACGSHNAEPVHREVGQRWLDALGIDESELSCGGHLSLLPRLASDMTRDAISPSPLWSNCSGKHAALLASAYLHGYPTSGYERHDHPVQQRVEATIAREAATPAADLAWGVDGCTAAAVALPLRAMALAYSKLGVSSDGAMAAIRGAMMDEPYMVAGADRLDTVLMQAWPGRVVVKIGAEGVYSAALPTLGIGLALKVEDGDMKAAGVALVGALHAATRRLDPRGDWPSDSLSQWMNPPIRNTRGETTGSWDVAGTMHFT